MITAEVLLAALGKVSDDPSVKDVLRGLGVSEVAPVIEDGVSTAIEATQHGVALFFRTAHHLRNIEHLHGLPRSTAVVSDVKFHWRGYGDGPGYSGRLPYELSFTNTRDAVRARLGPPAWSSPIVANDRWTFGDRYLTIAFDLDGSSIAIVSCGLHWVL